MSFAINPGLVLLISVASFDVMGCTRTKDTLNLL
jgi:hypothetical protein